MQSDLLPAQVQALQIGDPDALRYWRSDAIEKFAPPRMILDKPVDWSGEFLQAGIDEDALRVPDGVALADLPTGLQVLIRRAVEETQALDLMRTYNAAFTSPEALREAELTLRVAKPKNQDFVGGKGGRMINVTAPLQVDLLENGQAVHSWMIRGQQARQGLQETVRRNRELEARMNTNPVGR